MMKRRMMLMMFAAALTTLGAVSAFAAGTEVKADVPFAFYAGNEKLPAGTYLFIVDDPSEVNVLTVESRDGKRHEFALTHGENESGALDRTELVFDRYGSDYFLSEVRIAGFDEGRALQPSARQRAAMRHERVTLALPKKG